MPTTTTTTTSSRYGTGGARKKKRRAPKPAAASTGTRSSYSKRTTRITKSEGYGAAAAVIGGGILLWLLWPKDASASTTVNYLPPGSQGPQGQQGPPGAFVPAAVQPGMPTYGGVPSAVPPPASTYTTQPGQPTIGYVGPGTYTISGPSGLKIRQAPSASAAIVTVPGITQQSPTGPYLPQGTSIEVVGDAKSGWVQISGANGTNTVGFVCISCPQAPPTTANLASGQYPPWARKG